MRSTSSFAVAILESVVIADCVAASPDEVVLEAMLSLAQVEVGIVDDDGHGGGGGGGGARNGMVEFMLWICGRAWTETRG